MSLTREDVYQVLNGYLSGTMSKEDAAQWAYDTLYEEQDFDDPLISEVMYSLASFHDVGLLFVNFRPSEEKLQYLQEQLAGTMDYDVLT